MSVIPDPSFTARVYRARQLICGQYASWAAEMHMLHLPVLEYFYCPEEMVESVCAVVERVSGEVGRKGGVPLAHQGVAASPEGTGDIFLDFTVPVDARPRGRRTVYDLRTDLVDTLQQVYGLGSHLNFSPKDYQPRIALMSHARLPSSVFAGAVEFARAVVRDLEIPQATRAWQLALVRFQSEAAGDDWEDGRWAADLRWEVLASHRL